MTYFSPIVLPTREHSGAGKGGARTGTRPEEDRGLACSLGLRRDGQTGRRASWGRPQSGHRKKRWLMVGPMGGAIGAPGRRAVKNGRGCSEDRCPGHMRGCPRRKSRNGGAGNRRAVDAGTGHATRETMALRRTMPPEIGGPVDPILLCATGLVAGGLLLSAPGPVIAAAAAIACLLVASRRATGLTAAVGVIAIGLGGLRARSAVTLYETERAAAEAALGPPTRCSARARVASSPVRVRGGLRWDAELTRVTCADAGIGWEGRATLYGGPDDFARGDQFDVVATLAPPQRFWNASTGDPRPSEARRRIARSGGLLDARVVRRGSSLVAWIRSRPRTGARTHRRHVSPGCCLDGTSSGARRK